MTFRTTLTAAFAAAAITLGAPLMAQDDTMVEPSNIAAEDVTDAQVDAFVEALVAIEDVRKEYTPKLQAAEDDEARAALAEEANQAALAAVGGVDGISAADYLGIGKAASGNKELNDRILAELEERKAE